jgi:hypothetical protein
MSMLGFRGGSWWLSSKKDPRWNCNGSSDCVGGFCMPEECEQRIKELTKILGKKPSDLEYGYMKD